MIKMWPGRQRVTAFCFTWSVKTDSISNWREETSWAAGNTPRSPASLFSLSNWIQPRMKSKRHLAESTWNALIIVRIWRNKFLCMYVCVRAFNCLWDWKASRTVTIFGLTNVHIALGKSGMLFSMAFLHSGAYFARIVFRYALVTVFIFFV